MGRGKRLKEDNRDNMKAIIYIATIATLVIVIALIFVLSLYKNKVDAEAQVGLQSIDNMTSSYSDILESASSTTDKTIEEVENSTKSIENIITDNKSETISIIENESEEKQENIVEETDAEETVAEEEPEEKILEFIAPTEGEIMKDYSEETLVYSNTLKEWTVHLGVDIKSEEGSAVVASEDGIVESIKNDPRYGLTITVDHGQGLKTVYSNLLSAEFVSEGQTVEKGQTIGSVGVSAIFEIADESHLHFEMLENNKNVNPTSYWK